MLKFLSMTTMTLVSSFVPKLKTCPIHYCNRKPQIFNVCLYSTSPSIDLRESITVICESEMDVENLGCELGKV